MKALLIYGDGSLKFIESECARTIIDTHYRDASPRERPAKFHLMGVAHASEDDDVGPQDAGTLIYAEFPQMKQW